VFVVSALTGLRLDWKSPAREAAAVAWGDALARIGTLALPPLALLALLGEPLFRPSLAPLLLPLLLAVPFTVWSAGLRPGLALQRARILSVPDEEPLPRELARGAQQRGFTDLLPARSSPRISRPPVAARGRFVAALASVALVVMVLLPRAAVTPGLSAEVLAGQELMTLLRTTMPRTESIEPGVTTANANVNVRPQRAVRYRPARMIDDDVRRRAYDAVARALETG
jgi:membrane glycosyltransferase